MTLPCGMLNVCQCHGEIPWIYSKQWEMFPQQKRNDLPSGYLLHSHGIDDPFIDGLPIQNGGSFHGELLVINRG